MSNRDNPAGFGAAALERCAVISRRAALAGAALVGFAPSRPAGASPRAAVRPVRVGVVEGLGLSAGEVAEATAALFHRPATLVPYPAWGALGDHAAAGQEIEAAVWPVGPGEAPGWPRLPAPAAPAAVLLATPELLASRAGHAPARIGIALRHPAGDAAIRDMLGAARPVTIQALAAPHLFGNVAAGLLHGAVLLGADAASAAARAPAHGLLALALDPATAAVLRPALALVPCRTAPLAQA